MNKSYKTSWLVQSDEITSELADLLVEMHRAFKNRSV